MRWYLDELLWLWLVRHRAEQLEVFMVFIHLLYDNLNNQSNSISHPVCVLMSSQTAWMGVT